jgi:hypothetical protein
MKTLPAASEQGCGAVKLANLWRKVGQWRVGPHIRLLLLHTELQHQLWTTHVSAQQSAARKETAPHNKSHMPNASSKHLYSQSTATHHCGAVLAVRHFMPWRHFFEAVTQHQSVFQAAFCRVLQVATRFKSLCDFEVGSAMHYMLYIMCAWVKITAMHRPPQ